MLSITKSEMWYLSYLYKDCLETGREYRIYSEAGGGQSIVTAYIDTACQDAGICSVLERYGVQLL